jgi:hypothetical protein
MLEITHVVTKEGYNYRSGVPKTSFERMFLFLLALFFLHPFLCLNIILFAFFSSFVFPFIPSFSFFYLLVLDVLFF